MTDQQLRNLADLSEQIYPRLPYTKLSDEVNAPVVIQREAFYNGIQKVIDNPTDFGLVSMETMFELADFVTSKCTVHSQNRFHRLATDGCWYTTHELFQLFNLEKPKIPNI